MARKQLSGFIVYLTNEKSIDMLSDEEAGQIFKALFKVARNASGGNEAITEPKSELAKILFYPMAEQVRQNAAEWQEKADINRVNASQPRRKAEIATAKTANENSGR